LSVYKILTTLFSFVDYFVPGLPQAQRFYTPAQMAQMRPGPRWAGQPNMRQSAPGPAGPFPMQQSFRPRGGQGANPQIRQMGGRPMPGKLSNKTLELTNTN